jgi:hypothetical protein
MTTPLDKELKRELDVQGQLFTLTVSPEGLKLVPKGKRNGVELRWSDLVSGGAALSAALNASLERISTFPDPESPRPRRGVRSESARGPKTKFPNAKGKTSR